MRGLAKGRVLEVGCGPGAALAGELASGGLAVVAADAVWRFLTVGPSTARPKGLQLVASDAAQLPFRDGAFDTVCAFDTLEHIEDDGRAVAEWARVATRAVVLSVPSSEDEGVGARTGFTLSHWQDRTHYRAYDRETLGQLLKARGFKEVAVEGEYPLHALDPYLRVLEARRGGEGRGRLRKALARVVARVLRSSIDPEPSLHLNLLVVGRK